MWMKPWLRICRRPSSWLFCDFLLAPESESIWFNPPIALLHINSDISTYNSQGNSREQIPQYLWYTPRRKGKYKLTNCLFVDGTLWEISQSGLIDKADAPQKFRVWVIIMGPIGPPCPVGEEGIGRDKLVVSWGTSVLPADLSWVTGGRGGWAWSRPIQVILGH